MSPKQPSPPFPKAMPDARQVARRRAEDRCRQEISGKANMTVPPTNPDADRAESYVSEADTREYSPTFHAIIARLNDRWRVIDSCERHLYRQWILQYRTGSEATGQRPWTGKSFCQTRAVLLRCIREKAGEVNAVALAVIEALPDRI
jgi:hypothetical protein